MSELYAVSLENAVVLATVAMLLIGAIGTVLHHRELISRRDRARIIHERTKHLRRDDGDECLGDDWRDHVNFRPQSSDE